MSEHRIYEPLRLICEDQSPGSGPVEAVVMIGMTWRDDSLCFIRCVPDENASRMAELLREHADMLDLQAHQSGTEAQPK